MTDNINPDSIRELFMSQDDGLMPDRFWADSTRATWDAAKDAWITTMLYDYPPAFGMVVEFSEPHITATSSTFDMAMQVQAEAMDILRSVADEAAAFNGAWAAYFPDEQYVDAELLPRAFRSLVIKPAVHVRNYQLAMNRVQSASGTGT